MKKRIALVLGLAMLVTSLAACGGKTGGDTAKSKTSGTTPASSSKQASSAGTSSGAETNEVTVPAHKEGLIIGTDADINNLDLQEQQDQINNIVLKNTHQTLVFFNNGSADSSASKSGIRRLMEADAAGKSVRRISEAVPAFCPRSNIA